ncbi:hypothetical protein L208DRAFT_1318964 [Tricholoma matsutake]|nr:hypothetical protein L208DRAFT_1318964 [Tricholoma matsutake 945]
MSVTEVAKLILQPLSQAIYGQDFRRGPISNNGTSIFICDNISTAHIFSIIGEIKGMISDGENIVLLLGRPSLCETASITDLSWQQQIYVLEKLELADLSVDQGLHVVCKIHRFFVLAAFIELLLTAS